MTQKIVYPYQVHDGRWCYLYESPYSVLCWDTKTGDCYREKRSHDRSGNIRHGFSHYISPAERDVAFAVARVETRPFSWGERGETT